MLFFHDVGLLLLYVKGDFDIGFVKNGGVGSNGVSWFGRIATFSK